MVSLTTQRSYTFDVKLFAAVTLKAASAEEARAILNDTFQCADCNGGLWPDGTPVLFEASADGEADLMEIDSESN